MRIVYTVGINVYSILIYLFSYFNPKAKLLVDGRKEVFKKLIQFKKESSHPIIWFHCASLGEFEQGRPLIEKIKSEKPNFRILLSFFSPSGFEVRKQYPLADFICYLPSDSWFNSKRFIRIVKPQMVFFVKYEYWYNYIYFLYREKIPLYIVSAIFRNNQLFFKPWGYWFRKQLKKVSFFYAQNSQSIELLKTINIQNAIVTGDTRFDRVSIVSENPQKINFFDQLDKSKTIIIGSSWYNDELLFKDVFKTFSDIKIIIAPHEVNEERISQIEFLFSDKTTRRFSKLDAQNIQSVDVIIVDGIGFLSSVYQYGRIAYIGGGFGKGIHNILEAACFGIPVIFGPNYYKFQEAISLISEGGAFSVKNSDDLNLVFSNLIFDEILYKSASTISSKFVNDNKGACNAILKHVFET